MPPPGPWLLLFSGLKVSVCAAGRWVWVGVYAIHSCAMPQIIHIPRNLTNNPINNSQGHFLMVKKLMSILPMAVFF